MKNIKFLSILTVFFFSFLGILQAGEGEGAEKPEVEVTAPERAPVQERERENEQPQSADFVQEKSEKEDITL